MRPFVIRTFLIFVLLEQLDLLNAQVTPPNITNVNAHSKTLELFKAHIKYKEMTIEIAKRSLVNFLDELDPLKAYMTEEEVAVWLYPSDSMSEEIVVDFNNQKFTQYELIYATMLTSIERRNLLEERISSMKLPVTRMTPQEIQEANWSSSTDELQLKLLNIRAIQADAGSKLSSQEQRDLFSQRVKKRRISYEKSLIQTSKKDQKKQVLATFLKSVASSLDAHTVYFTPTEAKQFLIQVQQRLFGIGAQLRDDLNGFTIVDIIEGGPAQLEGSLKVNDKVIAVDHEPVIGMDILEAIELIRGERGAPLILTVLREGNSGSKDQKFDIEITRDEVVLKESRFEAKTIPYGDSVIAHLSLHSFYQDPTHSSAFDLEQALTEIKQRNNVKGVILDLRFNSGGLLSQAVQVTGLFIQRGVVASIKDYTGRVQRLRNLSNNVAWDGPLIILINKTSASASEIVALALADYGRALVVGDESSFGKGSYQTFTFDGTSYEQINAEGEYKVTRGGYYTVGGKSPQLTGVPSEIVVPGILSQMEIGEKYAKYPLEYEPIKASFEDDLSDVHPIYRQRLRKELGKNTQQRSAKIYSNLDTLTKNSQNRIKQSQNYQAFINEINNKNRYELDFQKIGQSDHQLYETVNIMKEVIYYHQKG